MNGVRMAALYLHGLEESDRDWLLNSLSTNERYLLNEKLLELTELGIPQGTAWLPEITIDQANKDEESKEKLESQDLIDAVNAANHETVFKLLDNLPVELVVLILNLNVWSWRQTYISKQYLKKRKAILQALEKPCALRKQKVQNALLQSLSKQLLSASNNSSDKFDLALKTAQNKTERSVWRKLWRR